MIALLVIVYTAIVLLLFKVLKLKPTPFLIAGILVSGRLRSTKRCAFMHSNFSHDGGLVRRCL